MSTNPVQRLTEDSAAKYWLKDGGEGQRTIVVDMTYSLSFEVEIPAGVDPLSDEGRKLLCDLADAGAKERVAGATEDLQWCSTAFFDADADGEQLFDVG